MADNSYVTILAVFVYVILIIFAIYIIISFYTCDNYNCKCFNEANITGKNQPVEKEQVVDLLNTFGNDSVWAFAIIGSAILTSFFFWFTKKPTTPREYGMFFLIGFLVIYALFSYYQHHYVKVVANYTKNYIENKL